MPCFCPHQMQNLSTLTPRANISLGAVPPQLGQLAALLGLANGGGSGVRADLTMNAALPCMTGQDWLSGTLSAALPNMSIKMPAGGPPLLMLTARIAGLAGVFPMHDMKALLMDVRRTVRSMRAHLMPFSVALRAVPGLQMAHMVTAARLTLSLRGLGICPMALSGMDSTFSINEGLGNPQTTFNTALSSTMDIRSKPFVSYGLPFPKLNLALSLAAIAPLANVPQSLGLPALRDPNFAAMAMNLLSGLTSFPDLPFSLTDLVADLIRMSDLSAINLAFGLDAMTLAGVSRIQGMLNYFWQLNIPRLPHAALSLHAKLAMLPSMDAVNAGAQVVTANASAFANSLRFNPVAPAILHLLEAINTLRSFIDGTFGQLPTSACGGCLF